MRLIIFIVTRNTQISTNVTGVDVLDSVVVEKLDTNMGQIQEYILVTLFNIVKEMVLLNSCRLPNPYLEC